MSAKELIERLQHNPSLDLFAEAATALLAQQAKIDSLMLEFCPEEMTEAQKAERAKNQQPASGHFPFSADRVTYHKTEYVAHALTDDRIQEIWQAHLKEWPEIRKTLINPVVFARAVEAECQKPDRYALNTLDLIAANEHAAAVEQIVKDQQERLQVLEREHAEFYERWHDERRKREALQSAMRQCLEMLLTEPDTKAALFRAEEMLRAAITNCQED